MKENKQDMVRKTKDSQVLISTRVRNSKEHRVLISLQLKDHLRLPVAMSGHQLKNVATSEKSCDSEDSNSNVATSLITSKKCHDIDI